MYIYLYIHIYIYITFFLTRPRYVAATAATTAGKSGQMDGL